MFSALTKRKRQSKVSVGQRYQKRDAPLVVWEVTSLFRGTDGMPYASMIRVDEPSMQKTVAQAILERGLHYALVGGR